MHTYMSTYWGVDQLSTRQKLDLKKNYDLVGVYQSLFSNQLSLNLDLNLCTVSNFRSKLATIIVNFIVFWKLFKWIFVMCIFKIFPNNEDSHKIVSILSYKSQNTINIIEGLVLNSYIYVTLQTSRQIQQLNN